MNLPNPFGDITQLPVFQNALTHCNIYFHSHHPCSVSSCIADKTKWSTVKSPIWGAPNTKTVMFLVAQYIHNQVLSGKWRCSWSSADRRCSNYIWVIDNLIAYWRASYIRGLVVIKDTNICVNNLFLQTISQKGATLSRVFQRTLPMETMKASELLDMTSNTMFSKVWVEINYPFPIATVHPTHYDVCNCSSMSRLKSVRLRERNPGVRLK